MQDVTVTMSDGNVNLTIPFSNVNYILTATDNTYAYNVSCNVNSKGTFYIAGYKITSGSTASTKKFVSLRGF